MPASTVNLAESRNFPMGFREFVAIIAAMMAISALGIDAMLPGLPAMGKALGILQENNRQWIVVAYTFGFGSSQLVFGPLIDRYGRKPILLLGVSFFALTSFAATFAFNFETIIAARALQGVAASSTRVLAVAIVRDRFSGRPMARVMSLTFVVFLAVPILAPSLGQLILLFAPWEGIFVALGIFGILLVLWASLRLPETLHPEYRQAISISNIAAAIAITVRARISIGYTLASTFLFGGMTAYVTSVQQIFGDTFHLPGVFTFAFAACAGLMGLASFVNSRIVERLGSRLVSHTALICYIAFAAIHTLITLAGGENVWSFSIFQGFIMGCFGLASSNFSAMAMEPVGHIAGTAASVQGMISVLGGSLLGILIAQQFNGTTVPFVIGTLGVGMCALISVLITERGRLFHAQNARPI